MHDEPSENPLSGADREFEEALRSLAPVVATALDPISAAFEAGQRSQSRVTRRWRAGSFIASLATVAVMIVAFGHRAPVDRPMELVRVDAIPAEFSEQSVIRLRNVVLDRGWSALPATAGGGASSGRIPSVRDAL